MLLKYFRRIAIIIYGVLTLIILCQISAFASKQTFAYIMLSNGKVLQYRVDTEGKFYPLKPEIYQLNVKAEDMMYSPNMVIDHRGRYAYFSGFSWIYMCKINNDGSLGTLSETKAGSSSDMTFNKSGRFFYVANYSTTGKNISQFSVKDDGTLNPIDPPIVRGLNDLSSFHLATHPIKPYLYVFVATPGIVENNPMILQYKINSNGKLSRLKPFSVPANCSPGKMVFSSDGKWVYISSGNSMYLSYFKVSEQGQLEHKGNISYNGYQRGPDFGYGQLFNGANIVMSSSNKNLFVTDNEWSGLFKFNVNADKKVVFDDSYWVENNRLLSDSDLQRKVRSQITKNKSTSEDTTNDTIAISNAYHEKFISLTSSKLVTESYDGTFYGFGSFGIIRFGVDADGSIIPKDPAFSFTKGRWLAIAKNNDTEGYDVAYPVKFLIVTQK